MEWKDIDKGKTISEREKLEKKFYLEEIDISNWLEQDCNQKILFLDRIEYKINGKLHRLDGPAIEPIPKNPTGGTPLKEYWINGEKFNDEKDWLPIAKRLDRKLKLKVIKNG